MQKLKGIALIRAMPFKNRNGRDTRPAKKYYFFFDAFATVTFTLSPTFTSARDLVSLPTVILEASDIDITTSPFFVFTVIVFALTSTAVTSPFPVATVFAAQGFFASAFAGAAALVGSAA